jgi:hypothetical protein
VYERGVFLRQPHQRRGAAGKNRRGRTQQIDQRARIAHGVTQSDIARRNAQAGDIGMRVRHQNGQRVVYAGVGIDQELRFGHGRHDGMGVEVAR